VEPNRWRREIEPAISSASKTPTQDIVALRIGDAGFLADVGESAVAIIVKEMSPSPGSPRGAHQEAYAAKLACARGDSACLRLRMLCIEFHVPGTNRSTEPSRS